MSNEIEIIEQFKIFYNDYILNTKNQEKVNNKILLRKEFQEEYPIERFKTLTLEEYALGTKNSQNSLSYKLETGKYKDIIFGLSGVFASIHGIYYNKDKKSYVFCGEEIKNPKKKWEALRNQICDFLLEIKEIDFIPDMNKYPLLSRIQVLLTKLCCLYYPEKFVNVRKNDTLNYFIEEFDFNIKKSLKQFNKSFEFNKCIRENISEVNDNDPQYIGDSLWDFYNENEDIDDENYEDEIEVNDQMKEIKLNTILYGAPGTGKTYNTINYAVAICDNKDIDDIKKEEYEVTKKRFDELLKENRIKFTTFHQSYDYEEFIEGIKPTTEEGNITYNIEAGVFKEFCNNIETSPYNIDPNVNIWKVTILDSVIKDCFDNNVVRIGYDSNHKNSKIFVKDIQIGDIIVATGQSFTDIIGIAIVKNDANDTTEIKDGNTTREVEWIVKDIHESVYNFRSSHLPRATVTKFHHVSIQKIMDICNKYTSKINEENCVFIIDEINRGNISKIFGELITLIEENKRKGNKEEMSITLPYSKEEFSIPNNLYILGTMNTADRSIALMDIALRRRFDFVEFSTEYELLKDIYVENYSIKKLVENLNKKITSLKGKDYILGHSIFLPLKDNNNIKVLANIFKKQVLPLLEEYFYGDYEKIRYVLGDKDNNDLYFYNKESNKDNDISLLDIYTLNENLENIELYKKI